MIRVLLLALVVLSGCAHVKQVEIESNPPGYNVEFDGSYLGTTPIKTKVTRKRNEWSNRIYASEVKVFKGDCHQIKTIGKDMDTPDKMFFDMSKCEAPAK